MLLSVMGAMVNASAKKRNLRIAKRNLATVEKNNEILRGVVEYGTIAPEDIFFFDGIGNISVSGGNIETRTKIMGALADFSFARNEPIVILHESNKELETVVKSIASGTDRVICINSYNQFFEPFTGLAADEISKLLLDSAPKDYDIQQNARYYIEAMAMYLECIGATPSLNLFAKCPHADLADKTDALIANGKITNALGQKIKSKIMMGQSEMFKIENYINELRNQIMPILSTKNGSSGNINIIKSVESKRIILIDIVSPVNNLLINLLVNQIKHTIRKGYFLNLVVDNISNSDDLMLYPFISARTDKCCVAVIAGDLLSVCGGDDKLFNTIIGNSSKIAIMNHASGASSTKWADSVGFYEKTQAIYSHTLSPSQSFGFSVQGASETTNYNKVRENIIKPEEINRMQPGEVYMYDSSVNQVMHFQL